MSDMPDKQTTNTFEEWIYINLSAQEESAYMPITKRLWNAATEATRSEYNDKIKVMQAEIDELNAVILDVKNTLTVIDNLRGKDCIVNKRCHCFADTAHFKLKELSQRGEDE